MEHGKVFELGPDCHSEKIQSGELSTHMIDSHYISNPDNAHIDTTDFEDKVRQVLSDASASDKKWEKIFRLIESNFESRPDEPNKEQLICRYFSPEKFLWFVSQKSVYFGRANQFQDVKDSFIAEDFYNAVLKVLHERGVDGIEWNRFLHDQQGRWLVSCWTRIDSHFDDNLLWHSYAGGPAGVGVTVRYEVLCNHLIEATSTNSSIAETCFGNVAYGTPLLIAPFSKRRLFRNENEVRFALRSDGLEEFELNLESVWDKLGLRLSPEVPQQHVDAISRVWKKFGGSEANIHIAGA